MTPTSPPPPSDSSQAPDQRWTWLRRFGLAGFLFFLGKGLLWLTLPTLLVMFGVRC